MQNRYRMNLLGRFPGGEILKDLQSLVVGINHIQSVLSIESQTRRQGKLPRLLARFAQNQQQLS